MLKKLDKLQIALVVFYIILAIVLLAVPYRETVSTGQYRYGFNHLMNWAVIIYSLRVMLNSFGWELFGVEKHLFGIIGIELSGLYFKAFVFKENYNLVISGIISELVVVLIFCAIVYLDKTLYYTGNKKDYEISMDKQE